MFLEDYDGQLIFKPMIMRFKIMIFEFVLQDLQHWFNPREGGIFGQCMVSVSTQHHEQ
jgi:hypothetical protein